MLRKLLIGFGALLGLLLIALIVLPMVFKKDIEAKLKTEINKSLNATVGWSDLSLTFFAHFPSLSITLDNLTVVGKQEFAADTLAAIKRFDLAVNPWKVIFGGGVEIKHIYVNQPSIYAHVLPSGKANWDIALPDSAKPATADTSKSTLALRLDSYTIRGGLIRYLDEPGKMAARIDNLNHSGSGNFEANIFDLKTKTTIDKLTYVMDGVQYARALPVSADVTLNMDLDKSRYTFKENWFEVNGIKLGFDGWIEMREKPRSEIEMDLKFQALETRISGLLALVPGVYAKDIEKIKSDGKLSLQGTVKGIYTEKQMPGYSVSLQIKDGSLRTPEVPEPVQNLQLDVTVANATGLDKDLAVDLKQLHAELAGNAFDVTARVRDMKNLDYALTAKGAVDFAKLTKFIPVKGATIAGKLTADVQSAGRAAEIQAQKYDNVKASGNITLRDFAYRDPANLPQGTTIKTADFTFTPREAKLANYRGTLGRSDIALDGALTNYLAYALGKGTLTGNLTFSSNKFDVNEWMSSTPDSTAKKDTTKMTVVEVPAKIDFTLRAGIKEVLYDKMTLTNFGGMVIVRNQTLTIQNAGFGAMGGTVNMNANYNTQNAKRPTAAMDLDVKNLSIPQVAKSFVTVKQIAPVMEKATGTFNGNIKLTTALKTDMSPELNSINANGVLQVQDCKITGLNTLEKLGSLTKLANLNNLELKNTLITFEIKNGRIYVKPFDIKAGEYTITAAGSNGFDQTLDYNIDVDMPAGQVGQMAQDFVGKLLGTQVNLPQRITMAFNVSGNMKSPAIKPLGLKKSTAGAGTAPAAPAPAAPAADAKQKAADKLKEEAQKLKEKLKLPW